MTKTQLNLAITTTDGTSVFVTATEVKHTCSPAALRSAPAIPVITYANAVVQTDSCKMERFSEVFNVDMDMSGAHTRSTCSICFSTMLLDSMQFSYVCVKNQKWKIHGQARSRRSLAHSLIHSLFPSLSPPPPSPPLSLSLYHGGNCGEMKKHPGTNLNPMQTQCNVNRVL